MDFMRNLESYNVVWNKPGKTDRSAMPIGNGEVGVSVWVEEDGDLQFYFGRTDTLTELDRNVKLGKVKISLSPNPFVKGNLYCQELKLIDGQIIIEAGEKNKNTTIKIFVDSYSDIIYVSGNFDNNTKVEVKYINWRNEPVEPWDTNPVGGSPDFNLKQSADKVMGYENGILFYHENEGNCIEYLAKLQGLSHCVDVMPDLISNRLFGGYMALENSCHIQGDNTLVCSNCKEFTLKICTNSQQIKSKEQWINNIIDSYKESADLVDAEERTKKWWNDYWENSWIFVQGDEPKEAHLTDEVKAINTEPSENIFQENSRVTQGYILTKWMYACMSRGNFPIRYNGGLFNLMPGNNEHYDLSSFGRVFTSQPIGEPTLELNPDERSWSVEELWQNIRLPYHSMLARGEYNSIKVLFNYYRRFWNLNRERAKTYYNAKGQHNTEMTLTCGLQSGGLYGYNREGKPLGYCDNRWGGAIDISPGLELTKLMLEYYKYTEDDEFLINDILPYSKDLLLYIETRFTERKNGKIVIGPVQSVETYFDTIDPTPIVAGIYSIIEDIIDIPDSKKIDKIYYRYFKEITPNIPTKIWNDKKVIGPARIYKEERMNVEHPELYTVFPFKLYGVKKDNLDFALDSYKCALEVSGGFRKYVLGETPGAPSYSGWQYTGMVAALLGQGYHAKEIIENNCGLNNLGFKFPVMWGPIYDAVPDIDHGANILSTLQLMVFQTEGDKLLILPAWPKHWNVNFKMHGPKNTMVECVYENEEIKSLKVTPKEREKDIIICI